MSPVAFAEKTCVETIEYGKSNRIHSLDLFRGIAMVFVVFYHFVYDLIYINGANIEFFHSDIFDAVHTFFLIILFFVSGICTAFSRNSLKRGVFIFLLGEILTIGSNLFSASDTFVFGVLSFFGASMMITAISEKFLKKINPIALFFVGVILYIMFFDFVKNAGTIHLLFADIKIPLPSDRLYLYPIGILHDRFSSLDYFPLVPNYFVFLAGFAISKFVKENKFPKFFYKVKFTPLEFIGKHSLLIYALHQPAFIIILSLVQIFCEQR